MATDCSPIERVVGGCKRRLRRVQYLTSLATTPEYEDIGEGNVAVFVQDGNIKQKPAGEKAQTLGTSTSSSSSTGSGSGGTSESISWEDVTDWDNAVSVSGMSHESVSNTDHDDESVLKQGYAYSSPSLSANLKQYLPCEDSGPFSDGDTIADVSGNNNDASAFNDPTEGSDGLLGGSVIDLDGSNDGITSGLGSNAVPQSPPWTIVMWLEIPANGPMIWRQNGSSVFEWNKNGNEKFKLATWGNNVKNIGDAVSGGTLTHIAIGQDSSANTVRLWQDGVRTYDNNSYGDSPSSSTSDFVFGVDQNNNLYSDMKFFEIRQYSDLLTDSEVAALYDVVASESTLTTATKSFSSSVKPNLSNLSYTLNGQSITIDVIGSPGTGSEETISQSLSGDSSYSLSWSSEHTDFRVKPRFSGSDFTASPTLSTIGLTA